AERRVQEDDPKREPAEEIGDPVADPIASFEGLRLEPEEREDEIHPESHGDSTEEREDRKDGVEGEPDEGTHDGPGDGCDGGSSSFDFPPHEADFVEIGRNPSGGVVLALPAGHWAVGSRGGFKNLRSPRQPTADCAARNAYSEIRSGPSSSSRGREGPSHGERPRPGPAICAARTTAPPQARSTP